MTAFKVDHLHVICSDLQEMIRFWTEGVGATFKEHRVFGGAKGAVLMLDGLQVNLRVPKEDEKGVEAPHGPLGYDHLGFRVEDLDSACSRLADFGCRIHSGPVELSDRKIAFLKGPEDITLELMQMF